MKTRVSSIMLLMVILGFSQLASAQKKMGRYHKNLQYEADIYYAQGDYYYASELYTELCKVQPNNGELLGKLGICYFNLPPMKHESERFLELAVKNKDEEAKYYLAKLCIEDYRFFDAMKLLDEYREYSQRLHSNTEIEHLYACAERGSIMVQAPLRVTIRNLGESVNSSMHDYAPVWDLADHKLYFTSRRRYDDQSIKDISEQYDENIFFIDLNSEDKRAFPAPDPLNTRTNDAVVSCSQDGKQLMVFRTRKDGFSGDLYETIKDGYTWGELVKLDSEINTKHHEASASFGRKGVQELFFSSDRPGGYGGKDIYRIAKLPNGEWGQPQNLGETINTPFDEDAPFIAADGSLYFASEGHETMGGYDIFCSVSEGFEWKKPVNMGYPINTPGDDVFFTMDPTGTKAYFSSERPSGLGLQDIYEVVFDEANTIIYRGQIITPEMELNETATVTLFNDENGKIEGRYQVDPESSSFVLPVNTNKNYTILVEADGYKTYEQPIFFNEGIARSEVVEQVKLSK
jgi:tetratricopeptide (TPR) repeat protein